MSNLSSTLKPADLAELIKQDDSRKNFEEFKAITFNLASEKKQPSLVIKQSHFEAPSREKPQQR